MTSWTAWSDNQPQLPAAARSVLAERLRPLTPSVAAAVTEATVHPSRLTSAAVERLEQAAGKDSVRLDDETRARHAGGQSYVDIARRRRGDAGAAPDAVVEPADAAAVTRVLQVCAEERIAVVPWGGGTSVVGGLDA